MGYEFSLWDVVVDKWLLLLLPIFFSLIWYSIFRNMLPNKNSAMIISIVFCIFLYAPFGAFFILPHVGSKWKLVDNKIITRAWGYTTIDLPSAKVLLVPSDGRWAPAVSHKGGGYKFSLKNGIVATVLFPHLRSEKMLVVYFDKQYFLFIHPEVETLYHETLHRGAQHLSTTTLR